MADGKKQIIMYDTTLRDGMQGLEINYSLDDKLQIAHKLDEMNFDYIEGGFPLSNEKEAAFFEQAKRENFRHAKLVAFGSTRRPHAQAGKDPHIQALLDAETPTVIVVGKSWTAHVLKVLKTDLDENLRMIEDSIQVLKAAGREAFLDLEHFFDGYKSDPEYAVRVLKCATQAGADCLILCDTNGGILPNEAVDILNRLPQSQLAPIGVHYHNDTGTAVANSILSLEAGAVHVQGTINGWGERCGNANLCAILPNIALKMNMFTSANEKLDQLTGLSRFVAEKANMIPDKRQPYVGDAAFSHKAGQHADVLAKDERLMEHISASLVGNERRILLSELAGKSTIVAKLAKYGDYAKDSPEVEKLIGVLKEREGAGYEYEAAEGSFDILMRKTIGSYNRIVDLNTYHLEAFKAGGTISKTVGKIFLRHGGMDIMGAAVGTGPVEALDLALRDALLPFFPALSAISLTDYRVRVLNPENAAAAKVRVFITSSDHNKSWDTVGVSENIVEASWEALVDSIEFYYNNYVCCDEGKA